MPTDRLGPVQVVSERSPVGELIERSLRETDRMWPNQRVADPRKNVEADFFLALPVAGFIVLEIKGGQVSYDGEVWAQTSQTGHSQRIDPVTQARDAMYALRTYVEGDARWGSRGRVTEPRSGCTSDCRVPATRSSSAATPTTSSESAAPSSSAS